MTWLLNVYYFSLGLGGVYLLVAGALGAIGSAGAHGHVDGAGHDFGTGHEVDAAGTDAAGHDALSALPSTDLDAAGTAGEGPLAHDGSIVAGHKTGSSSMAGDFSPFNLLNFMCLLASFGGIGLLLLYSGMLPLLTFPLALAAGTVFTGLFHWLVTTVMQRMQAPAVPTQDDMLGIDAEVLTPLDTEHFGEVAYVLDGQRFTSPAKLLGAERAGRKDPVTIVKVEGSIVYVEPRRKLLE